MDFITIKCNTCGSKLSRKVLDINKFTICECKQCNLRYLNPQPTQKYLKHFYSENYYSDYVAGGYLSIENHIKEFWTKHLNVIEKKFDKNNAQLLEVGSACGLFLKQCKDRGWNNIMGVEFSDWSSEYARNILNLDVRTGDLTNIKIKENHFDIIVMWATIEHLSEPKENIDKIYKLLKTGGVLILNTGNDEFFYRLLSTGYCMWYNVPEHLYFYNSQTIKTLLKNAGFLQISIEKDEIPLKQIIMQLLFKLKTWIMNPKRLKERSDFGKLMTAYAYKQDIQM